MKSASTLREKTELRPVTVRRAQRPGVVLVQTGDGDNIAYDITLVPLPHEAPKALLERLRTTLAEIKAVPTLQLTFGSLPSLAALRGAFGTVEWPVTWADGSNVENGGLAGLQIFAVSERPVERARFGERAMATIYEDGLARHCLVGGLGYDFPTENNAIQTRKTLQNLDQLLCRFGFEFRDIARTWFYLDHILTWYDDFNKARTAYYNGHKFRLGSLPASTGISASNPWKSALSLAAWAIRPLDEKNEVAREIVSPMQCPAACYGSSFSRAIEFSLAGGRRISVSGTASIEPGGKTVHNDDIDRQINLSLDVVAAILRSRGMSLEDASRITAYFKKTEYRHVFNQWRQKHNLPLLATLPLHCDICRDDLLFEIELDAVKSI
jgi:enamine deaminase RidA (YjgF/YER057c/UK114 family)